VWCGDDRKEIMEKRFLISIIVVIALIVIGLPWYYFLGPGKNYIAYQKTVAGLSGNEAILVLDNGQQERMFKGEITEGMTVTDVLEASGLAGNEQTGLRCSLNGKDVGDQAAQETVHPKDKIVCKY